MTLRKLLSLLLALVLLAGLLPTAALAAEWRGGAGNGTPPETTTGDGAAHEIWAAIEALEAELLPEDATAEQYAGICDQVLALVEARPDVEPGSINPFDDGFFFVPEGGNPNGWFPDTRTWKPQPVEGEPTGQTLVYPGEAELCAVDEAVLMEANTGNFASDRNVTLLEPYFGFDESFTGYYRAPAQKLADYTGGSYIRKSGTDVNIQAVADAIASSGVVLIDSHGTSDKGKALNTNEIIGTSYIFLTTRTNMQKEDYAIGSAYQLGDTIETYYHAYDFEDGDIKCVCVDGIAIANHMNRQNPNGLVWFGECQTMKTNGLGKPLLEMGVAVVFGWSQNVAFKGEEEFSVTFLECLSKGKTVSEAAYAVKKDKGYWDPEKFKYADKEAAKTYSTYQYHAGTSWDQFMKTLYPDDSLTARERTRLYEKVLESRAQGEILVDNGWSIESKFAYFAFPVFMSKDDPYPAFDLDEPGHLQDVYSDWHLPKKGDSIGNYDSFASHFYRELAQGEKLTVSCTYAYAPGAGGDYYLDTVSLVSGALPEGISWTNQGSIQLPKLSGVVTEPGLSEPEFAIRYRDTKNGDTRIVYQTFHIMVKERVPVTGTMNAAAYPDGTEQQIVFQDPKPIAYGYYDIDQTGGTIPPGMTYYWAEAEHPRFTGTPIKRGVFTSTWRIIYINGTVCNYTVTVIVESKDPISATQNVTMTGPDLARTDLVLEKDGVDYAGSIWNICVRSDSRLPKGIALINHRSAGKPYLIGRLLSGEDSFLSTVLEGELSDGRRVELFVDFDIPCQVCYDLNGHGKLDKTEDWVVYGDCAVEPLPEAEDYIFGGWYTEPECENAYDFSQSVYHDLKLYAKWDPVQVTEFYNAEEDGDGGYQNKRILVTPGSQVEPVTPAPRAGYTFKDWYQSSLDMRLGNAFDFKKPAERKLTVLYPQFEAELTGISLSAPSVNVAPGGSVKLTAAFEPWNAQPELTWTTDSSLVTVDPDGTVHVAREAANNTVFSVTAAAGKISDTIRLSVQETLPLCIVSGETDAPVYVSARSAANILAGTAWDGVFSYDAEKKTLTISGDADLRHVSIRNEGVQGLTIGISGNVTMTMGDTEALSLSADTAISGGGTLTVTLERDARSYAGITVGRGAALSLEGVTIRAAGSAYGICGNGGKLVLRSTSLQASSRTGAGDAGAAGAAIGGFSGGIELYDTILAAPANGRIENGTVLDAEGAPAQSAAFRAAAPLPDKAAVTGTVLAADGLPAVNYPVRIGDQVIYTDENGRYTAEVFVGAEVVEVFDPAAGIYETEQTVPASDEPVDLTPAAPAALVAVRFDAGGGSGEMEPVEVSSGQLYTLPDCGFAAPDPLSMAFDRWDQGAPGDLIGISEETVLTARWRVTHVHDLTMTEYTEPGCETEGRFSAWYCADCGRYFLDEECTAELNVADAAGLTIPPLGHEWEFSEWIWSENNSAADAVFVCTRDPAHTLTVPAVVAAETVEPKDGVDGRRSYTATVTLESESYTDQRSERIPSGIPQNDLIDTEGHSVTWFLDPAADTLTVTGDLGGEPLTVTAYDGDGNTIGDPLQISETGKNYSGVIPEGAQLLEITWNGQSETVDLSSLPDLSGDFTGNGVADADDASWLVMSVLFGEEQYPLGGAAGDLNKDGKTDLNDAAWLLFHRVFIDPEHPLSSFIAAAYDAEGRMTDVRLIREGDPLSESDLAFLKNAAKISFFYLDGGSAPLARETRYP